MFFLNKKQIQWWNNSRSFVLNGEKMPYFVHSFNCGWPPFRMTERSVELSLADRWLSEREGLSNLIEIGAVTPYYWPNRIKNIVDPFDPNRLVNIKKSIFDVDLTGKKVLSISTFEHIGNGEYGLPEDKGLAMKALSKVFGEAQEFLITIPVGYNESLDDHIFNADFSSNSRIYFLTRDMGDLSNNWKQVYDKNFAKVPYQKTANGLIVLESAI